MNFAEVLFILYTTVYVPFLVHNRVQRHGCFRGEIVRKHALSSPFVEFFTSKLKMERKMPRGLGERWERLMDAFRRRHPSLHHHVSLLSSQKGTGISLPNHKQQKWRKALVGSLEKV